MIYAIIVAGGKGTRMGNTELPKQFMSLKGKPILIHTLERFLKHDDFFKIVVVCPKEWISYTKDVVFKYVGSNSVSKVCICTGGSDRNESIMSGIQYIENAFGVNDDDVVLTHDAVRPLVTRRIIDDNIESIYKCGAVGTFVSAIDTIASSSNGEFVESIPERNGMYQAQTPQTFNITKLVNLYDNLDDDNRSLLSDATKIFVSAGMPVAMVKGELFNIKITTPQDIKIAESLLEYIEADE